jgi:hypothetical protein
MPLQALKRLIGLLYLQVLFQDDSQAVPDIPTVDDFLAAMEAPFKREEEKFIPGIPGPQAIFNPAGVKYFPRRCKRYPQLERQSG